MSHSRERNEANCLNCDTEVIGRYCHVCGQENIEPRESFWSLITHFFNDITHFDGKFFRTTGQLVSKPGFLPSEYMKGKRARYLHPIRMYLFTSALFFLVFYTYTDNAKLGVDSQISGQTTPAFTGADTVDLSFNTSGYTSVEAYDSVQNSLPESQRDSWLEKKITRRNITIRSRYGDDINSFVQDLLDGLVHSLPTLLFVSLPIFALLLKMLYSRSYFVYADHAIYLVFLYIFMFVLVLSCLLIAKISSLLNVDFLRFLIYALSVYGIYYSFYGMKRFYGQSSGKTLLKYLIFNIAAFVLIIILFVIFLLLTLFRV